MGGSRTWRLEIALAEHGLDAFLVTNPYNIYYLTGFPGALGGDLFFLIVSPGEAVLPVDFRYFEEAKEGARANVVEWKDRAFKALLEFLPEGAGKVGFEADAITYARHRRLAEVFQGIELVPLTGVVEQMRLLKDEDEIEAIVKAAAITDAAFEHALSVITPGVTEREMALEIEYFMRRRGADKPAFETIVASGRHSAVPHARVSDKPIATGDFVKIDLGAAFRGYCSDMTRTVVVGGPAEKQREVYETVRKAQNLALEAVRPGSPCRELDALARTFIDESGFGGRFGHSLGHGVGLEAHENPALSSKSEVLLAERMVVTIEPGVYIEGWGGVRIEDLVLVTAEGHRVLSRTPKELIEV